MTEDQQSRGAFCRRRFCFFALRDIADRKPFIELAEFCNEAATKLQYKVRLRQEGYTSAYV
ncbi:hypothetical protein CFBP5877_04070 [Agrobacterium tumefaciens]|uniref:Uncharacterized protein n=1 Tax=Agrobacterium tumefaciens TaxID=358 RepID=A0AAE6EG53_AGRTU|nr:hypothetical protein CFBP5499_04510 [Agrobacterium tumefaciens]QCL80241.1 hypothetical protein CFBP5877_04070 [Agrobacterium tumefaciens]